MQRYYNIMLQYKCLIFETNQSLYMKSLLFTIVCALSLTSSFAQREVLYTISITDFFDSDANGQGDIKGVREKLNDLQFLGVTTIVLSPVYDADANFAAIGELDKINTQYGNFKEYRDLIQELHNRKMKLYQTVNLQYVNAKHVWFKDSFKNTKSVYSDYIYYSDDKNEKPVYNASAKDQAVIVNLKNDKVVAIYNKALTYWADPDRNGVFYDGVDGFVFKDVQDKPDASGKNDNLLTAFWQPLSAMLKKINPAIQIITEPTETTTFRHSLYDKASANGVPAYKLKEAIRSLDKAKIIIAADSTFSSLTPDKYPVVYVESQHDSRLASSPKTNIGKLRVQAALNLFMGGIPVIHNGQEIALKDGADAAIFQGSALKEQQADKNSLWNYYKELIKIKINPVLATGDYKDIHNSNDKVVSFLRTKINPKTKVKEVALVVINLSAEKQIVTVERDSDLKFYKLRLVSGTPNVAFAKGGNSLEMTPYSAQVWVMMP